MNAMRKVIVVLKTEDEVRLAVEAADYKVLE